MHVIIDWVANHTAWDNTLVEEHPDWFNYDENGKHISPYDWSDVIDLNYDKSELWDYMIGALQFWVEEANIDGYRCDVAFLVPTEFWNRARKELEAIKPVFMLAEAEEPEHHQNSFDMSYAWNIHQAMNAIGKGQGDANRLDSVIQSDFIKFPLSAYRMHFTSNHDENSWNGTEYERLGEGAKTFAVLAATIPGMPLIYSGQEAALNRRLEFFEKDVIDWVNVPLADFYHELLSLKKQNPTLWNGNHGGTFIRIPTEHDVQVYAYVREKDGHKVFVVLNLSSTQLATTLAGDDYVGTYQALFGMDAASFEPNTIIHLNPWEYRVYHK